MNIQCPDPKTLEACTAIIQNIVGVTLAITARIRGAREKLLNDTVARYLCEIRRRRDDDDRSRLGAMQRVGVAKLSRSEVQGFAAAVKGRTLCDPLKNLDIFEFVPFAEFSTYLRSATERGIDLSVNEARFDYLITLIEEREREVG